MRDIKFRAWDGKTITKEFTLYSDGSVASRIGAFLTKKPLVIMQFTGLHDKNGKEIFESDIVRYKAGGSCVSKMMGGSGKFEQNYWIKVVEFFIQWNGPHLHPFQLSSTNHNVFSPKECEVLGNIYENPDLIK